MAPPDHFVLFGPTHLMTLAVITIVGVGLPILARRILTSLWQFRLGIAIGVLLLIQEGGDTWFGAVYYGREWFELLPLHLCGISVYLIAWVLVGRAYRPYEVVYFWAWGGTLQALLTPELAFDFPHPAYFAFFLGHGLVILGVLYATVVYRFRPWPISIVRSLVWLLVLAALVAPVNSWFGTNYLFISGKPAQASLMDYLGPWPWYILGLAGLGVVSSLLYYSPFFVKDLLVRRREAADRPTHGGSRGSG